MGNKEPNIPNILNKLEQYWALFDNALEDDPEGDQDTNEKMRDLLKDQGIAAEVLLFDWKATSEMIKETGKFLLDHPRWHMVQFEDWHGFEGGSGDDFVVVLTSSLVDYDIAEKIGDLYYNKGAYLPELPDSFSGEPEELPVLTKEAVGAKMAYFMSLGRGTAAENLFDWLKPYLKTDPDPKSLTEEAFITEMAYFADEVGKETIKKIYKFLLPYLKEPQSWAYEVVVRYQDNGNPCVKDYFSSDEALIDALQNGKSWEIGAIYAIFDKDGNDVMEKFDSSIHDMYHEN